MIILQVGSQRFHTSEATLSGSSMLASMISQRWSSHRQPDGSYFIDADPEIFNHILRFLRHGIYPLCYSLEKGHDYGSYAAVHAQAQFLMIAKLAEWVREQRYLQVVRIESSAEVLDDVWKLGAVTGSDARVKYYPSWRVKKKCLPAGNFFAL